DDVMPGGQVLAHPSLAVVVEVGHGAGVPAGMVGRLRRDGVDERLFGHSGAHQVGGGAPGVRLLANALVVRDDVRVPDQPGGLEGDQLRVAGSHSDAEQPPAHSRSCARALRAEAAIAEPPRRPVTARYGTSMPESDARSMSACLDSAAPMKPTGVPMIAAGRGAPSRSISSRWNRAVGALPNATTAPSRRSA